MFIVLKEAVAVSVDANKGTDMGLYQIPYTDVHNKSRLDWLELG